MGKTAAKADSWPEYDVRLRTGRLTNEGKNTMANQEMKAAEQTYSSFIELFKVGSVAVAITTILVILLIS